MKLVTGFCAWLYPCKTLELG